MAVTRVTGPLGMCSYASCLSDGEPETCCHRDLSDVPIKHQLQYYGPPYPLLASLLLLLQFYNILPPVEGVGEEDG